mmetsp:Transcript_13246/g.24336  ORF Transcript_13246/g.24336 Transcript_13246/m.24336 type:complete len:262 (+) Transcript_13246:456-1241(+)
MCVPKYPIKTVISTPALSTFRETAPLLIATLTSSMLLRSAMSLGKLDHTSQNPLLAATAARTLTIVSTSRFVSSPPKDTFVSVRILPMVISPCLAIVSSPASLHRKMSQHTPSNSSPTSLKHPPTSAALLSTSTSRVFKALCEMPPSFKLAIAQLSEMRTDLEGPPMARRHDSVVVFSSNLPPLLSFLRISVSNSSKKAGRSSTISFPQSPLPTTISATFSIASAPERLITGLMRRLIVFVSISQDITTKHSTAFSSQGTL